MSDKNSFSLEGASSAVSWTDTHCHIHEESYPTSQEAYQQAIDAGVCRMICVGTDLKSSREAVQFADSHDNVWSVVGIHPHEASREGSRVSEIKQIVETSNSLKTVGIGEIGLDYYYQHSPRPDQIRMLESQLDIALAHNLPVSFHVRDAFDDFWPVFDNFHGIRGVVHSFTDSEKNLEKALERGLYIGINGIATFARDKQAVYKAAPLSKILLETDAPFLTPRPLRGTMNEPALLTYVAEHLATLQSINLEELSQATEAGATHLFGLK